MPIPHLNPNDVVVIGVDTIDGEEHALYDRNVTHSLRDGTIDTMQEQGVQISIPVILTPVASIRFTESRRNYFLGIYSEAPVVVDYARLVLHARAAGVAIRVATSSPQLQAEDALSKAKAAQVELDLTGNPAQVAAKFRMTRSHLNRHLGLLARGCPEVHQAVEDGSLGAIAAMNLVEKLPVHTDQQTVLKKALRDGMTSASKMRKLAIEKRDKKATAKKAAQQRKKKSSKQSRKQR